MLKVYEIKNAAFSEISATTFEAPASISITPGGSAVVKKLYLRNDDATKYYEDITTKPTSILGADLVDGGLTIKLLSGDAKPKESQWAARPANSASELNSPASGPDRTVQLPNIGSSDGADLKYYPFWVRIEGPRSIPVGIARFSLGVTYTEGSI